VLLPHFRESATQWCHDNDLDAKFTFYTGNRKIVIEKRRHDVVLWVPN